jgi:hypothetical protein
MGKLKKKKFFNTPLLKCRDERSEFYGSKEGQGRDFMQVKKVKQKNLLYIL